MNLKKTFTFFGCAALLSFPQINNAMETVQNVTGQIFSQNSAKIAGVCAGSLFAAHALLKISHDATFPKLNVKGLFEHESFVLKPTLIATALTTCAAQIGNSWPKANIRDLLYPALGVAALSLTAGLCNKMFETNTQRFPEKLRFIIGKTAGHLAYSSIYAMPLLVLAQRYINS